MTACLASIDTLWTLVALLAFAFAIGARICYEFMGGRRGLLSKLRANDEIDVRQQAQLDTVAKQVDLLMRNKRVKRVTIKRRVKEVRVGNQTEAG